jgi:hypothetical protein
MEMKTKMAERSQVSTWRGKQGDVGGGVASGRARLPGSRTVGGIKADLWPGPGSAGVIIMLIYTKMLLFGPCGAPVGRMRAKKEKAATARPREDHARGLGNGGRGQTSATTAVAAPLWSIWAILMISGTW